MKNFERKDKNERRRVLLSKNNVNHTLSKDRIDVDYSDRLNHSDATGAAATSAVLAKVQGMNKRVLALLVVLAMLVTLVPIVVLAAGEDEPIRYTDSHVVDIDGLYLNKTVTQDETNLDKYHIKLEALAEADTIEQPITDIVMTMDLSSRMGLNLYSRNYKNLNTHTTFSSVPLSSVAHNSMFDKDNPHNNGILGVEIGLLNPYEGKKYVEDPNHPGTYVYLSTTWRNRVSLSGGYENLYTYSFTDSSGNVYTSPEYNGGLIDSVFSPIDRIDFSTTSTDPSVLVPSYYINSFYERSDDNALNTTIDDYAGNPNITVTQVNDWRSGWGRTPENDWLDRDETVTYQPSNLFILSDSGEKLPVSVVVERRATRSYFFGYSDPTYYPYRYTYTATDGNKTYTAIQGNSVYGGDFGVFQGFKVYEEDANGNLVVKHDESIESKSLYTTSQSETVTRLQAMKEASEKFIIQLHQDAFKKNPDVRNPNVRLGIITYGDNATPQYNLPDINLSNEVQTNAAIDKIYAFTAADRPASELDYAMNAVQNQFDSYSKEGTIADGDGGKENKKISILFSSGVPTRKNSNIFGRPRNSEYYFNETVANNAIATADSLKKDMGVLSYTVGLFNGASTTARALYGDKFDYTTHVDVLCNGKVGSVWGQTSFNYLLNGWVHNVDVPATNRVMNYISSNYSDADRLGLTWKTGLNPGRYWLTLGGSGWQITNNYSASSQGHYFAIPIEEGTDVGLEIDEQMTSIFGEIASAIEIPSSTLGSEDQLVDFVTDYFDIVDGSISAHTETPEDKTHYQSTSWSSNNDESYFQNKIVRNGKKISVDGFDYQAHSMTKEQPQKLVLEFDVLRKEGLIGGNAVPTNTTLSGVYDIVQDEHTGATTNTLLEESFRLPTVDLDIQTTTVTKDAAVYYGSVQNLTELVTTSNIDGFNNSFVDITYDIYDGDTLVNQYVVLAGQSEGEWVNKITADEGGGNVQNLEKVYPQMTKTTEYRIVCTVDPTIIPGTLTEETIVKDENDNDPTATVYVFNPHVEVHNDELSEPGEYDLTEIPDLVSWNCKDKDGEPLEGTDLTYARGMLPAEAPPTTLVIEAVDSSKTPVTNANVTAYQIDETMDFVVSKVKVVPATFTYESWEHLSHEEQDEDGQTVVIDDGYDWVAHTINGDVDHLDWPAVDATYANNGATFNNTSDGRDNGQFTITVGKHFDMVIDKWFTGEYANLQEITITVTPLGENDAPDTAHAQSRTFAENEFDSNTYKAINTKSIEGLDANTTYLITETFATDAGDANEPEKEKYDILFVATSNDQAIEDGDGSTTNNEFKLIKGNDENAVSIVVTNQAKDIPVTGIAEDADSNHALLYILVGVIVLAGGSGGLYLYKKREGIVE